MKNYLKGPGFAAWLRENGLDLPSVQLTEAQTKAVNRWKNGDAANFYTAEFILTHLGLYEWEIPADLWIEDPKRGAIISPEQIEEIISRSSNENPTEVARAVGCSPRSVYYHLGKAAA